MYVKHMNRMLPMILGGLLATAALAADDPKLVAEAKIKETEARATALAQIKNGTVRSEELEREHGHLIYSYDIQVAGKPGIDEVNVDALTGKGRGKDERGTGAGAKGAGGEGKEKKNPKPERPPASPKDAPGWIC